MIYRSSVLPSTAPCQCVITQPKIITDHFAFADSMPHHARARPVRADMHAAAGEVDAKLEETSTVPCQRVITQPKIITDPFAFADSMPHHARARPAFCGHARRSWRSGCEVGRDDLQVFSFALQRSVPMRNNSANFFTDHFAFADSMPHHARARPALGGHAAAGEVDAKLEETIYRSSVLPSPVPCQCVITQPIFLTDHFAFADSMPHHARARPMPVLARTCTPPLCSSCCAAAAIFS
jgi:hypothetical protein